MITEESHVTEARKSPLKIKGVRLEVNQPVLSIECVKDKMTYDKKFGGGDLHFCNVHIYLHFRKDGEDRKKIVKENTIVEENIDVLDTKLQEWLDEQQSELVNLLLNGYACGSGCE